MKKQGSSKTNEIIKKGASYENDRYLILQKSEKRAWGAMYTLAFLLTLSIGGYFFLLPIKEVKPYVLGFDKSTGIVDPLSTVSEESFLANDALDRFFINQYLQLRESYFYETIQDTYEKTQKFSSSKVAKDFREDYNKADSLDSLLGEGKATVKVNSITLEQIANSNMAIARIRVHYKNKKDESFYKDFTVRLSYIYEPETKLQLSHRIDNPVGFFVTSYQKIEENN